MPTTNPLPTIITADPASELAQLREVYRLACLDAAAAEERKAAANSALKNALYAECADIFSAGANTRAELRVAGQAGALRMAWNPGRRTTDYDVLAHRFPDAYAAAVGQGVPFWTLREVS